MSLPVEPPCTLQSKDIETAMEFEPGYMDELVDSILKSTDVDDMLVDAKDDLVCETCIEFGTTFPAEGYCLDCQEYLCLTCFNHHRTPRPFKHHLLKGKDDMPRRPCRQIASNIVQKRCILHPDYNIVSYCQSHDQLCCESCILIGHRVCKDINSVDFYGASITNNTEFQTFNEKIRRLHTCFEKCNCPDPSNLSPMELIDKVHTDASKAYQRKLDALRSTDRTNLDIVLNVLKASHDQIKEWLAQVKELVNDKRFGELFILMKRTHVHLLAMKESVHQTVSGVNINKYMFKLTNKGDGSDLGVLRNVPYSVEKVRVKQSTDKFDCVVRTILILQDDLILLSDYGSNNCLKLINTKQHAVIATLKLKSGAWHMTLTDDGQVFVTQPSAKKLLCLQTPMEELNNVKEINIKEKCCSVEYTNNALRIQCVEPCKLLELDLEGKIRKEIHPDISKTKSSSGETIITHPYSSVMDRSTGSMYVSCYHQHSITEVTTDGLVRLIVKTDELKSPSGLCLDMDGSILVCCKKEKRVYKVTLEGQLQPFLPDKLSIKPSSLAFNSERRKMFVGGDSNYVYMYQL